MMPMDLRPQSVQKMMLSPRMLLAAHVLQLNILDLRIYLRLEIEENPLLEEEVPCKDNSNKDFSEFDEQLTRLSDQAQGEEDVYNSSRQQVDFASWGKQRFLESLIVKKESLYEHLLWQLNVLTRNERQRRIGQFLIGNLDEDGYLNISFRDIQKALGESAKSIKRALSLIRGFDPIGVGARDLKESLLIQLLSSAKTKSYLYKIIYFHLPDLARGNYEKIANSLRISLEEVVKAKQRIAHLEPKPGRAFSRSESVKIIPDVFLDKDNGTYNIAVNEEGLPRLSINRYYVKVLRNKTTDRKTVSFIRERFFSARWLLEAIIKRRQTIERVCTYLIQTQKEFLEIGERGIKPLTLRDVAEGLSISQATVSRVVSNKYLQTPQRIYHLKQFFAGAISQPGGKTVSDARVKKRIGELIEQENTSHPLSDTQLALLLKQEGINLSRRTVAKYRKGLKILPSRLRR